MSVKKFSFKSPGTYFSEDDNPLLPNIGSSVPALFIGRARKGGQMRPLTFYSPEELIEVVGMPISGTEGEDIWREGNVLAPTYAVYGALAYLKNKSPVTFIRLAGHEHPDRIDGAGEAGFATDYLEYADNSGSGTVSTNGGAYGLFIGDYSKPTQPGTIHFTSAGGALNDLSAQGKYTGSSDTATFVVEIVSVAPNVPDQFRWSDSDGNGALSVDITGAYQELANGIYIKFDNINGHTSGDKWVFAIDSYGEMTYVAKFYVNNGALGLVGETLMGLEASPTPSVTSGIDDLEIIGHYNGTGSPSYVVEIDGSSPDTFQYSIDGGITWVSTAIPIGNDPIDIGNGLYAWFKQGDTSGSGGSRTVGDSWSWMNASGLSPINGGFATIVRSVGNDYEFKLKYYDENWSDSTGNEQVNNEINTIRFNFNPYSTNFIRKVFNVNPTLVNGEITNPSDVAPYWLGESFEQSLKLKLNQTTGSGNQIAVLLKIESDTDIVGSGADYRYPAQGATTGWVFAQDFSDDYTKYDPRNMQKLFRFKAMEDGEWSQANLKISIDNIRYSTTSSDPYGKFDVLIRKASDSDRRMEIIERYSNCNLNPNSPYYIGKQIGDVYYEYDEITKRYKKRGKYPNVSKVIYIEIDNAVESKAINPYSLPFGFYGQPVFDDIEIDSSSAITFSGNNWVRGGDLAGTKYAPFAVSTAEDLFDGNSKSFKIRITDRSNKLRTTSVEEGITLAKDAYWGILTSREGSYQFDPSFGDIVRPKSVMANKATGEDPGMKYSFIFSLDDVRYEVDSSGVTNTGRGSYDPFGFIGRRVGKSITAGEETDSSGTSLGKTPSYQHIVDSGMARFTLPFFGGFDGLDRTEKEPFRNEVLEKNNGDVTRNYAFYTISKIIDIIRDKDFISFDKVVIPGMTNPILNSSLVAMSEERKDNVAIIDIAKQYQPSFENYLDEEDRTGSVDEAVNELISYDFDTSYAVSPFNWLTIKDNLNNDNIVEVPPSVGYMDVLAMSENLSETWFAPAGYTRGNLSSGEAGLNYIGTKFVLNLEDSDTLAEYHFNPFKETSDGIIMMDNQTLQASKSGLSQIEVRMLMIYLKNEIQKMSRSILFDPNVEITWQRFVSVAEPFLAGVKTSLGLEKYKVVLDKSTTTKDLQERNIIYGKVYVKPMNAIRYVAIDFVLTNDNSIF